jgi:thiol-disulfide isomerase/thioredoxin
MTIVAAAALNCGSAPLCYNRTIKLQPILKAARIARFETLLLRVLLAALLLLAGAAPAAQIKLDSLKAGSRVYKNVTVLGINTTDVYFTHDGGITSVRLKFLEPELQKKFNYDPQAAAEAERQQTEDDARYNEAMTSNIIAHAQQAARAAAKAALTSQESLADPVSDKSLIGKPAPAMKGAKWLGEKPALEGKLLLINFWAPWSIPCRKYIVELNALQKKLGEKVVVVGLTSDSEAEIAAMPEPKIEFAIALDPRSRFTSSVGVTSVPYVLVVDQKGIVRYQGHPAAVTEKQLEGILSRAAE